MSPGAPPPPSPSLPPPTRIDDGRTAVPIDIERVEASVTFDLVEREASVAATVDFVMDGPDGYPVFDLRQPVGSLRLDGEPLPGEAFSHQDLGGGEDAEMAMVDRSLAGGSRHRLELRYRLVTPNATGAVPIDWSDGVKWDFWMSDLHPGRYLEMWLPANLCHDRFALGLDVEVRGTPIEHTLITNGADRRGWRVEYPAHFTSLSPMLVLQPAHTLEVRTRTAGALTVLTARSEESEADAAACEADIAAWLVYNQARYGPWAHGPRFTAVLRGPGRGMEYDGATTAAVAALEHEVFHSWFGRGVKPASAGDGWIDEAWTSWATSSRRREEGRFAVVELGLDEPPVLLRPPHPWSRYTPIESYRDGARLFAGVAHLLGGAERMRQAMADWYRANAGGFVTTTGLQAHLTRWSGVDVGPWFDRYVHGRGGREPDS